MGDVCEAIREMATKDLLEDVPEGTENLLAFNGVERAR